MKLWKYVDIFFLLRGGRCVLLIYFVGEYCYTTMLLIDLYANFFFLWFVTFAKVEHCQITETCGINWEDSVMVEPI